MKKLVIIITALIVTSNSQAKTWRVNNTDQTADFSSLDAAMTGITAGDTLYLEGSPNEYTLSSAIMKKVTIIGPGYFLVENPNTLVNKSPAYIASNVKIMTNGVTLEGISLVGSTSTSWDLTIGADNVTIRKCFLSTINFTDDNTGTTLQINNTIITQCYIGRTITSPSQDYPYNAIITNNIFPSNYGYLEYMVSSIIENNTFPSSSIGFNIRFNNNCSIKNNICPSLSSLNNQNSTIQNNYTAGNNDYVTSTSTDGKWVLTEISGARTAGTNNSQCGAFGGSSPYVLSGLPSVPHIYEIDAPTSASATSGLQVTVKIGTEK